MNVSLKWRIVLNMWVLAALCTVAAGGLSALLLIKSHEVSIEQQLKGAATTLISLGITNYSELQDFEKLDAFIEEGLGIQEEDQIIQVYTGRGKRMFSSPQKDPAGLSTHFKPVDKPTFSLFKRGGKTYKVLTTPYEAKNERDYFLQIAMTFPPYSEIIWNAIGTVITLFLILSLVAFGISHLLARKLVAPVRDIANYLNLLDPTETKGWRPLLLTKSGEYLADIVAGINRMVTRVRGSLYSLGKTSQYLAHELRNPLTIMIGEAEGVLQNREATTEEYKNVVKSSLEEVEKMNTVVATVMKISQKERVMYHPLPCSLTKLVDEHLAGWEESLGFKIEWARPSYEVMGILDADLLVQLIDNLVRNIKEHSGSQRCVISLEEKGETTIFRIEDFGKGMPLGLVDSLNRSDLSHPAVHIGLMLCLEIAAICKFKMEFQNKSEGGLIVRIFI